MLLDSNMNSKAYNWFFFVTASNRLPGGLVGAGRNSFALNQQLVNVPADGLHIDGVVPGSIAAAKLTS